MPWGQKKNIQTRHEVFLDRISGISGYKKRFKSTFLCQRLYHFGVNGVKMH